MEYRSLPVVAGLICLALLSPPSFAEDATVTPERRADWNARLEKARLLGSEAAARRDEASRAYAQRKRECRERFQVNACLDEARRDYLRASGEARRVENEGKTLERSVYKEQADIQDARRASTDARRKAEAPQREADTAAARRAGERSLAATRQAKEEQARAGERHRAEEAARHQRRVAEHQARVEARMQRAAEKAAREQQAEGPR